MKENHTTSSARSTSLIIRLRSSGKVMLPVMMGAALLSGFRDGTYSVEHLSSGAPPIIITLLVAWLGGSVLGPAILSWLPGESLPFKGWMAGILALTTWPAACLPLHLTPLDVTVALLIIPATTALLINRFTGTPPDFWRKSAPLQVAPIAFATGIWIMARFI